MIQARFARVARALSAATVAVTTTLAVFPLPGRAEPDQSTEPRPVRIVILVDVSGSLSPEGVAAERDAAALIAQAEFAPGSQVAVFGFASANAVGQSAVQPICDLTTVSDATARDYLSHCVGSLRIRTPQEGADTDFAEALKQGLSTLNGAPPEQRQMIFMLTDGVLDVANSPAYGDPARRTAEAERQIANHLATAKQRGVQIWPLGFGRDVNAKKLEELAAGGSDVTCSSGSAKPRSRVVAGPGDVVASLADAFASARCAHAEPPETATLAPGATRELKVQVPAIATDGSIAVIKRDPRVAVSYLDPDGRQMPKSGSLDGSSFSVSGESGPVEVLRITDPRPGRWTVRLTSTADIPAQNVSATVVWQGNVQSSVSVDPPLPSPGELVTVEVTIRTSRDAVAGREALSSVAVVARLTGDGFDAVEFPVKDGGAAPDRVAGDGVYTGSVTVPTDATGALTFTGLVSGTGIDPREVPKPTRLRGAAVAVRAVFAFDRQDAGRVRLEPGTALRGAVTAENAAGRATRVRLVLDDLDPGTLATVSPTVFDLPASGRRTFDFAVSFDARTQLGPAQGVLTLVDDTAPDTAYASRIVSVDIGYPPPWYERLRWLWALLLVLAVAAISWTALLYRRRRAERDVGGLLLELFRDGRSVNKLAPTDDRASVLRFTIRDRESPSPRLDLVQPHDRAYTARRSPDGTVRVGTPDGDTLILRRGRPEPLDGRLSLAVTDGRTDHGKPAAPPPRRSTGTATRVSEPIDDLL